MNIGRVKGLIRSIAAVDEIVRVLFLVVGCLAIHEFTRTRWPYATKITLIVLGCVTAVVFVWFTILAPFREGLREGKPSRKNEPSHTV